MLDCIDVGDLKSSLGVNQEVCFSAASVLSMGIRADAIVFVKDTSVKTGVAEVKLPGFNFISCTPVQGVAAHCADMPKDFGSRNKNFKKLYSVITVNKVASEFHFSIFLLR